MKMKCLSTRMVSSTRLRLMVLIVAIGLNLIVGCSVRHPRPTQTAELPSLALTVTPSPQPTAIAVPSSPAPTLTSLPVATPSPPPALSSDAELLVSMPISVFDVHSHPYKKLHSLDWSPDGRSLAYGWQDGIWIVQEPAYEPSLLVSVPEGRNMDDVSWAPGGQYLAFHGEQFLEELWGEFIWVVRSDGTGLEKLPADPLFDPLHPAVINQWLDDHTLTIDLWHGTGAQSLWQVDTDSGKATQLIGRGDRAIPIQACGGSYDWSPTHEHIAINHLGYGHLVLVDVSQASEHWFSTMRSLLNESFLDWSQDGQRFLYSQWDADEERHNLWLWDVARGEGEKLLPHIEQAALSPNGSRIAFLRQEDRPARVKGEVSPEYQPPALTAGMLDLETEETILYGPAGYKASEGPFYWEGARPVWSPDGELVVYWGEAGDVWAVSAGGIWQQRLTQGLEIVQVMWSPNGGKLALRSFDQVWIIERPQ